MSIIHTFIARSETAKLSSRDHSYLERKLKDNCMLNSLLNRKVNRPLLHELRCVMDKKPLPRRKTKHYTRVGKVSVYNSAHKLIRIEHASGRVMKEIV